MDVTWDVWPGWPSQIDVNARLGPLTRSDHCSSFRIGITGNPYERASRYESLYDELIVLYESVSGQHGRYTALFDLLLLGLLRQHHERRGGFDDPSLLPISGSPLGLTP